MTSSHHRTITDGFSSYRQGPYSWPTREQREAFEAALDELFKLYPPEDNYQRTMRADAFWHLRSNIYHSAAESAVYGGVPREHMMAVMALLF